MLRKVIICVTIVLGFLSMAPDGCLPPQKIDVSPDGRTMYFSLTSDGGYRSDESSNMYALDVERGRLRALTDTPGEEGWCSLTADGEALLYMHVDLDYAVEWLDLEKRSTFSLTGAVDPHMFPWVIPGRALRLLMLKRRSSDGEEASDWALYSWEQRFEPVAFSIPAGVSAGPASVAVGKDRFAVAVARILEKPPGDAAGKQGEVLVLVGDITSRKIPKGPEEEKKTETVSEVKVTQAARWVSGEKDALSPIDLAFSADGRRLVAALKYEGGKQDDTHFLELDPTGKADPKLLFKDDDAFAPRWTPNGNGIVYMRMRLENAGWREMVLRLLDAQAPVVLARLPGGIEEADTCLRWDETDILTAYHLSDDGVRLARIHPDLKTSEVKHLSREKLTVQRRLADVELALDKMARLPQAGRAGFEELAEQNRRLRAEVAGKQESALKEAVTARPVRKKDAAAGEPLKAVYERLKKTDIELRVALEAEWDKVDDWEKVPAVPDLLDEALQQKAEELERARDSLKEDTEIDDPAKRAERRRWSKEWIRRAEEELNRLKEMKRLREKH